MQHKGLVAQPVERLVEAQEVAGSTPAEPTRKELEDRIKFLEADVRLLRIISDCWRMQVDEHYIA
jgi:hypothetical protein